MSGLPKTPGSAIPSALNGSPLASRSLHRSNERSLVASEVPPEEQERQQFLAEFLQRLREAPPGTRVYMRVGDVFSDADVVSIDELRAAREAAAVLDESAE